MNTGASQINTQGKRVRVNQVRVANELDEVMDYYNFRMDAET